MSLQHIFNRYLFFQIEGDIEKDSEVRATYKDLHAKRPICNRLYDHTDEIQPKADEDETDETSEYRSTMNKLEVSVKIDKLEITSKIMFISGNEN